MNRSNVIKASQLTDTPAPYDVDPNMIDKLADEVDNVNQPMSKYEFMQFITITKTGCWEWNLSRNNQRGGYGQKWIKSDGKRKLMRAHRLAWWVFKGYEPKGYFVCHICDNPPCCNPEHLFLGDERVNVLDMHIKQRAFIPESSRGEKHHSSKLTADEVMDIKLAIDKGDSLAAIAKKYDVTKQAIWRIKEGKSWAWLKTK